AGLQADRVRTGGKVEGRLHLAVAQVDVGGVAGDLVALGQAGRVHEEVEVAGTGPGEAGRLDLEVLCDQPDGDGAGDGGPAGRGDEGDAWLVGGRQARRGRRLCRCGGRGRCSRGGGGGAAGRGRGL